MPSITINVSVALHPYAFLACAGPDLPEENNGQILTGENYAQRSVTALCNKQPFNDKTQSALYKESVRTAL